MKTRTWVPMMAGLLAFGAAPAAAQPNGTAQDAAPLSASESWSPWLGCWQEVDGGDLVPGMVCALPGDDPTAVRITLVRDGLVTEVEELRADGTPRLVTEGGCEGSERAVRSGDGLRVYVQGELDCGPVGSIVSRALAFVSGTEWIDVQSGTVGGAHSVQTTRYRRVLDAEVPPAVAAELPQGVGTARAAVRLLASTPLDVEAVIEAAGILEAPALEALLAARGAGVNLDGRDLRRLDAASVPGSVIDVMVALSYPDRFRIEGERLATAPLDYDGAPYPAARAYASEYCFDRYFGGPYGGYYGRSSFDRYFGGPYGGYYGRSSFDALCGYRTGFGRYGPFFGGVGRPVIVIVDPDPEPQATPARAVRGQGYTRGGAPTTGEARPRSDPPAGSVGGSAGTASQGSGTRNSAAGSASGSGTGRTAVPRPQD